MSDSTDAIRKILREIEERNNGLTAEAVVEAAKPVTSPLHARFTWDDTRAAREYRIMEARVLIRRFHVVPAEDGTKVREFHRVAPKTYRSIDNLSEEDAQTVAHQMERDMYFFLRRYQGYKSLMEKTLQAALDKLQEEKASTDRAGLVRLGAV